MPLSAGALTLPGLLDYCVEHYAEREALVFEGIRYTYGDVRREVQSLARALVASGVTKGTRVAVLFGNRPEFVFATFAIASLGGIVVPVSTLALPEEREHIIRHSDASLLLMQPDLLGRDFLGDLLERHPCVASSPAGAILDPSLPFLRTVVCIGDDPRAPVRWDDFVDRGKAISKDIPVAMAEAVVPGDDAMIIYTSGSTSLPKAVVHLQRAPAFQAFRMAVVDGYREGARTFAAYPFFWTGGFTEGMTAPLSAGATVVMQETFDPEGALALIEAERVTHIRMQIHDEIRLASHSKARSTDLSSIEEGVVSDPMRALVGLDAEVTDFTGYGASEVFTIVSGLPFSAPIELRRSTHGTIIPGQRIRIIDPESGATLGPGETGEIAVKGPTLMRGYYKSDPQAVFDEAGFFRTRDIGHFDEEGYLYYDGRVSDIIKTSGANVSPVEIQEKLIDWGRLAAAVVIGLPHPTRGQIIVLCAVRKESDPVEEEEIRAHLRASLSSFKIPRVVLFFEADELTYTSSRKVRLQPLRERAVERLLASPIEESWKELLRAEVAE